MIKNEAPLRVGLAVRRLANLDQIKVFAILRCGETEGVDAFTDSLAVLVPNMGRRIALDDAGNPDSMTLPWVVDVGDVSPVTVACAPDLRYRNRKVNRVANKLRTIHTTSR